MPEQETVERAREAAEEGKAPSTQAGEFVREEIHHVRQGKHGARSTKQAIAIGLSKARRAGVPLKPPRRGSKKTRQSAARDVRKGRSRSGKARSTSPSRSRASRQALKREGRSAASRQALSRQARQAARRRQSPQSAKKTSRPSGSGPSRSRSGTRTSQRASRSARRSRSTRTRQS